MIGCRRETSYMSEEPYGSGAAEKNCRTSRPLSGLVSYMSDGVDEPGSSKFSATPTPYAQGSCCRKARAPSRPFSSPSVNRKTTSLRGMGPARRARATSSRVTTPIPSSPAPSDTGTES